MCTNYAPVQARLLREIFGVEPPSGQFPAETWPDYPAPIVRSADDGSLECLIASFGMVPRFRFAPGAQRFDTTNARSETVGQRPAFQRAWRAGQRCLIPMSAFYEPNYENGPKAQRWRIWLPGEPAFAVAGLWRAWPPAAGPAHPPVIEPTPDPPPHSFTMLTIPADDHPLMRRMHAPGKEKRSIVIVPRDAWEDWLAGKDPELARRHLQPFPAQRMAAQAAPLPPRSRAATAGKPEDGDGTASLF